MADLEKKLSDDTKRLADEEKTLARNIDAREIQAQLMDQVLHEVNEALTEQTPQAKAKRLNAILQGIQQEKDKKEKISELDLDDLREEELELETRVPELEK